jgi:hypothetical protein
MYESLHVLTCDSSPFYVALVYTHVCVHHACTVWYVHIYASLHALTCDSSSSRDSIAVSRYTQNVSLWTPFIQTITEKSIQCFMHVYVCERIHMHVYVCERIHMHVYVCERIHMHVYVCERIHMHVYVCERIHTKCQSVNIIHTHVYKGEQSMLYACVCVREQIYTEMSVSQWTPFIHMITNVFGMCRRSKWKMCYSSMCH